MEVPKERILISSGNSHGKLQKEGMLGKNRARDDYLLQRFQDGKLIMINIPLPTAGGRIGSNNFLVISSKR